MLHHDQRCCAAASSPKRDTTLLRSCEEPSSDHKFSLHKTALHRSNTRVYRHVFIDDLSLITTRDGGISVFVADELYCTAGEGDTRSPQIPLSIDLLV